MGSNKNKQNGSLYMRTYMSSANVSILAMTVVALIELMMIVMTVINAPMYGNYLWRYRLFYILLFAVVISYIALVGYVKKDFPGRYRILNIANPVAAVFFFAWSVGITYNDFCLLGTVDPTVFMTFSLSVPLCFFLLPSLYAVIALIADFAMLYLAAHAPNASSLVINISIFLIFQFVLGVSLLRIKKGLTQEVLKTEEQNEEIEKLSSAQARFFSSVSHEIRTPINAVLGMDELILRESSEENTLEYAENIRNAGTTLLELINDILDFSKMDAGKMEIIPTEYAISSVFHDLAAMTSVRARGHGLKFSTQIDSGIPSVMIGDALRIKQVITNLLTNAVKYTEEGGVTLEVRCERVDDEHADIYISVRDTGIGIKKEDLSKLFTPFERIEEKRNHGVEGTGLGMNITMNLLDMMGSRLEVSSEYGEGSTFSFVLRQEVISWEPIGDFEAAWKESVKGAKRTGFSFAAPDAIILAVDDNAMNLKVLTGLLKPTGIKVDTADSGKKCLELITKKKYDLIYLDHRMPDMDGLETRRRMEELQGNLNEDTPVIALTANAISDAKEEYLNYGYDDYLSKPVSTKSLEKSLLTHLPDDKIGAASEDAGCSDTADEPSDGVAVNGLDKEFAMLHLSDEALFKSAVKDFYGVIDLNADKLSDMYKDLPNENAWEGYRIQVHGMKSTAATIGIIPLAGLAKILEDASGERDIATVTTLHAIFIKRWRAYKEQLARIAEEDEAEAADKRDFDADAVRKILEAVKSAMDDFDVDTADDAIRLLDEYKIPEGMTGDVSGLKAAVAAVDSERTDDAIGRLMETMEGMK